MSISELKCLLAAEFKNSNVDILPESLLQRALTARANDAQKAARLITNYIKYYKDSSYLFTADPGDPFCLKLLGDVFSTVSSRSATGEWLVVSRTLDWNPDECKIEKLLASINFSLQCLSMDQEKQKCGFILVVDTESIGLKYVRAMKPLALQGFFRHLFYGSPANLKIIVTHKINWAVDIVYRACKPFTPKFITDRIILIPDDEDKLAQYLSVDVAKGKKYVPSKEEKVHFKNEVLSRAKQVLKEWDALRQMNTSIYP